jgi:DNA uptake protein ComE-like DNA-binding protein
MRPALALVFGTAVLMATGPLLAADKASSTAPPGAASPAKAPDSSRPKLVDINSASRAELKTLPNIGDAEADKIIANRPYLTKSSLVSKKVLDLALYDTLYGRIVAMQNAQPKAQPKAKP